MSLNLFYSIFKTRLVPFIFPSIKWNKKGVWFEGFLGTGAVLFNAMYFGKIKHAIVTDINPYIINFYKEIQTGKLIPSELKRFMVQKALKMKELGKSYYFEIVSVILYDLINEENLPLRLVIEAFMI